jgi:hypothetical protein
MTARPVIFLCALILSGCALVNGKAGQQQALAVLVSCEPLQNGGRLPEPPPGYTCEQFAAEQYQQYSNDLKDAKQ